MKFLAPKAREKRGGKSWQSEKKCQTNRELDTKVAFKIYSVSVEVHLSAINQLAPAEPEPAPEPPTQNHPRQGKSENRKAVRGEKGLGKIQKNGKAGAYK